LSKANTRSNASAGRPVWLGLAVAVGEGEDFAPRSRDAAVARRTGALFGHDHQPRPSGDDAPHRGLALGGCIVGDDDLEIVRRIGLRAQRGKTEIQALEVVIVRDDDADLLGAAHVSVPVRCCVLRRRRGGPAGWS
jgi:hypothetical protein